MKKLDIIKLLYKKFNKNLILYIILLLFIYIKNINIIFIYLI